MSSRKAAEPAGRESQTNERWQMLQDYYLHQLNHAKHILLVAGGVDELQSGNIPLLTEEGNVREPRQSYQFIHTFAAIRGMR